MTDRALSVREVAERYGVGEHTVLQWIHKGELRAIDVSRHRGSKPRWRITADALAGFEVCRTSSPLPQARRRRQSPDVIEFYK